MAKYLADLWQRRTDLQHVNSQSMSELVRAAVWRLYFGSVERVTHD